MPAGRLDQHVLSPRLILGLALCIHDYLNDDRQTWKSVGGREKPLALGIPRADFDNKRAEVQGRCFFEVLAAPPADTSLGAIAMLGDVGIKEPFGSIVAVE